MISKYLTILMVACLVASAGAADTGRLIIYMRAGGSAMDLQVNLTGPQNESVKVLPHGWVDIRLPEGVYVADLLDGNAGQPERQFVTVAAGETSYVSFLGHAVAKKIRYPQTCSCPDDCEKVWVEEKNHTVHHEAETRVVTIVDEPAYCGYLQTRGHSEYRIGTGDWRWGNCPIVNSFLINCVIPVCEERWIPGEVIETCYPAVTHEETVTTTEAWDQLIVDSPAGWIEVCPERCDE